MNTHMHKCIHTYTHTCIHAPYTLAWFTLGRNSFTKLVLNVASLAFFSGNSMVILSSKALHFGRRCRIVDKKYGGYACTK